MSEEGKKIFTKKTVTGIIAYIAIFFTLIVISYYTELSAFFGSIIDLFRPVLIGLLIAYLLNPVFRLFERRIFSRLRPTALRRALSLLAAYLVLFGIVILIIALMLPQLFESIVAFVDNYETHVNDAVSKINGFFAFINDTSDAFFGSGDIFEPINGMQIFDVFYRILSEIVEQTDPELLTATISDAFSFITDIIFALFISLYLLASKEKRYAQVMKLRHAIFSDVTNKRITKLCTTADRSFGKFLEGKLLDSLIVLALTYIVTLIFDIPYAILIATITAIFNIIPIIGFLSSLIPTTILVALSTPEKILTFLLIMFVIYQIDANIISPKILGNNTGISALWVIISICTLGTLWGLVGMLLGVPLFATILELSDTFIHRRLQQKRLPDDVENYYAPDPIMDPVRTFASNNGKLIRQLEKRNLHVQALIEGGHEDQLTRVDRMAVRTYALFKKLRIVKATPPDILTQFAAEEAERQIAHDSARTRDTLSRHVFLDEPIPADADESDEKGA